ncbi:MAG: PRC-barrel domain-containing protein [Christensenella sp.]
MKKLSQVIGLKLMGIKEGVEVGNAVDLMIDTATKKVCYVVVQESKGYFGYAALPVKDISGIGKDYIMTGTLESVKKLTQLKDAVGVDDDGFFMVGTRVISCDGNSLGTVLDFSFEETTGDIDTVMLDNDTQIAGDKIITLSKELVFVSETGSAAIAQETDEPQAEEQESSAFEIEQRDFLLGRTAVSAVTADDGTLLVPKGTVITEEVISLVDAAGKLLELTLSVE